MTSPLGFDDAMLQQAIASRIALLTIHGDAKVDARSLVGLQILGVLKQVKRNDRQYQNVIAVVADPLHPKRVPTSLGPFVFIRGERDSDPNGALSVAELTLEEPIRHRRIALSHLDGLKRNGLLTPFSEMTLQNSRHAMLSRNPDEWKPAATRLYDALETDWLLSVAGLRQSVELQFDDGIHDYLVRVLQPSVEAVNTLELKWWEPQNQHAEIEEEIVCCAQQAETIADAADIYLKDLGYLPFVASIGLGRLVAEWLKRPAATRDVWADLWSWADENGGPVARYHVCQAALANIGSVPEDQRGKVWEEIGFVLSADVLKGNPWQNEWQLRLLLARHFCQYFEIRLPWNDGIRIPMFAWWLSERVASILNDVTVNIDLLQERYFSVTHLHWHLARARSGVSKIRTQTVFAENIWSRALLGLVGTAAGEMANGGPEAEVQSVINVAFAVHASIGFRYVELNAAAPFASGLPVHIPYIEWAAHSEQGEQSELVRAHMEMISEMLSTPIAQQLVESQLSPGQLSLNGLRAAAYERNLPIPELESAMRDDRVAARWFAESEKVHLPLIVDMLLESAAEATGEWRVIASHTLATACLGCENAERRDLLFILVVHCSIATDTSSALRRLLLPQFRHQFLDVAARCRSLLSSQASTAPQWVMARIRAVVAELDI